MEKVLQEHFWAHFFGRPYCSNGTKIHLDAAMDSPLTYVYNKSRSYDVWFLKYKVQRTKFFVILGHFFPFDPPNNPKNQNFEKIKKRQDILSFTLVYHKLQSDDVWSLRYRVWLSEFFVILDYFLPFYPPNNPENQNFEKMKKSLGYIIILQMSTINVNHMINDSWDMEYDRIFSHFGPFFAFLPPPPPSP